MKFGWSAPFERGWGFGFEISAAAAPAVMMSAHNDKARMLYLDWWQELNNHEKRFEIFSAIPKDAQNQKADNLVFKQGPWEIMHDIRGRESEYSLDKNGFYIGRHLSRMKDFSKESDIKSAKSLRLHGDIQPSRLLAFL